MKYPMCLGPHCPCFYGFFDDEKGEWNLRLKCCGCGKSNANAFDEHGILIKAPYLRT